MRDSSARFRVERQPDAFQPIEEDGYEDETQLAEAEKAWRGQVRRGALWGAGFIVGLAPLAALTVMGAIAGGLIARASHLRIERVSAPRIHFARRVSSQSNHG